MRVKRYGALSRTKEQENWNFAADLTTVSEQEEEEQQDLIVR